MNLINRKFHHRDHEEHRETQSSMD